MLIAVPKEIKNHEYRAGTTPAGVREAVKHKHRQCNYNQWLNSFRIEEVQRLIRSNPSRGMTEIMFAAGFQNKSTFNAAFLTLVGESPSSWRNQLDNDVNT